MNLILTRLYGELATVGRLSELNLFSIELPWLNNLEDQSCVPEGLYSLHPYLSPTHGPTWCLDNAALGVTWNGANNTRGYSELHSANWARELKGCIAFGIAGQPMLDPLTGKVEPAVEESKDAIAELTKLLLPFSQGHTLLITKAV